MAIDLSSKVGPFMGVTHDVTRTFRTSSGKRTFRIIRYGAYNAGGLIGPENNGIAVLDNSGCVVADQIGRANGLLGPGQAQVDIFERMRRMKWGEFQAFVNESGRNRFTI